MPATDSAWKSFVALLKAGSSARRSNVDVKKLLGEVLGERLWSADHSSFVLRANLEDPEGASYAGWITEPNATSGLYSGTSLVWFPSERGSVVTLTIGSQGFGNDTHILGRPGHGRRLRALARAHLPRLWVKPVLLDDFTPVPEPVWKRWPKIDAALKSYSRYIYAATIMDDTSDDAVLEDLFHLFFTEHGARLLKTPHGDRWAGRRAVLIDNIFPEVSEDAIAKLARERRFIIIEGPPGTGKTRMAERVARGFGAYDVIQFHPARTYEDFVVGLFPRPVSGGLSFDVVRGDLLKANDKAASGPFTLVIDEINRADLSRILGEALILFEVSDEDRKVRLPHRPPDHDEHLRLHPQLMVIGTRNTADRSIARMDLAIRRRFAFVPMWPSLSALDAEQVEFARDLFVDTMWTFAEHADDDVLRLVPGHAYFMDPRPHEPTAGREGRVARRIEFELLPLLQDYVDERLLAGASEPVRGLIDRITSVVTGIR